MVFVLLTGLGECVIVNIHTHVCVGIEHSIINNDSIHYSSYLSQLSNINAVNKLSLLC